MSITALVINEKIHADQLIENLNESLGATIKLQLVKPSKNSLNSNPDGVELQTTTQGASTTQLEPLAIESLELLNPKLARKRRQRNMALWLVPFGLFAGLSFSQMTGLETFAKFGSWGDPLISSLLGVFSGLIGSYVAAASVNGDQKDSIRKLLKYNQEGFWLLILEAPSGMDLPWHLMQQSKPLEIFQLSEL